MYRMRIGLTLLVAVALLTALPAGAELYTVKLKNGTSFDTLYQPKLASEAGDKVLIATDMGNWISLPMSAIDEVVANIEARGGARLINTTTIMIGEAPNDAAAPDETEQEMDPTTRLLRYFESQRQPEAQPFTVQQFAEPNSMGGIPLGFTNTTTPPMAPQVVEPPVAGQPPF